VRSCGLTLNALRYFGHLAYEVDDVYALCDRLMKAVSPSTGRRAQVAFRDRLAEVAIFDESTLFVTDAELSHQLTGFPQKQER
jgi:hypothetical protein